jgi:hypothetical protein
LAATAPIDAQRDGSPMRVVPTSRSARRRTSGETVVVLPMPAPPAQEPALPADARAVGHGRRTGPAERPSCHAFGGMTGMAGLLCATNIP